MNLTAKIDLSVWKELYSFHRFNPEMELIVYSYISEDSDQFLVYIKSNTKVFGGQNYPHLKIIDKEYIQNADYSKDIFFVVNGKPFLKGIIKSFKNFDFQ